TNMSLRGLGTTAIFLLSCTTVQSFTSAYASAEGVEKGFASTRVLSLGQTVEQEFSDTQIHSYTVGLTSGQFLRADLYAQGLTLTVSVAWPGRQRSLKWTGRPSVVTPICLIGDLTGSYVVTVQPLSTETNGGRYR